MLATKMLNKQKIEKQKLAVFLRDLSGDLNVNLKHMIEDNIRGKEVEKKNKGKGKNNRKEVIKKKDIIIREQNEKRRVANIKDDMDRLQYLFDNADPKNMFNPLNILKTDEGKRKYKFMLLEYFWKNKKKEMNNVILLYFELKNENIKLSDMDTKHLELFKIISDTLDECDYKLFMMKKIGHMLPPLNNWNAPIRKLDDWQEDVISFINKKESVIVKAPTSAGKSFIAMATGIIHKKILYVCPAKPVAFQVGSHFTHMGYKVHFILDNFVNYAYGPNINIFIGTPKEIENNLNKVGTDFDYVVFDEIHNLNKSDDGDAYENIIKLVDCNFLALSATIQNIDFLKNIFKKINPEKKINYVEYNKRFINHQRWIWKDDKLIQLHPLCAYKTPSDMDFDNCLSFTPLDCGNLWDEIEEEFEDEIEDDDVLDHCSPDEYFSEDKLLTLDDCKTYEVFIKNKLIEMYNDTKYKERIQNIFNKFIVEPVQHENNDIINFIRTSKDKDMFPMIMFHKKEQSCRNIFNEIYEYLNKKELEEYPYHYDILEKKDKLYQTHRDQRESFKSSIKISSSNAQYEIKDKLDSFDRKEKANYVRVITEYYNSKINFLSGKEELSDDIKKKQIKNLKKEMNDFIMNPDFNSQDVFKKHTDFIFTLSNEPMSGDTIRSIRREIHSTLGIKIPYESPLFQMLKRGIGLYIENMPDEYNWILQKLLSKKEIGIVISDKTLCMGIDLPVRTTCFIGSEEKFTNEDYLQMSGRAGRRNLDNKGNIVFFGNMDYLELMKGKLPSIKGSSSPINDNYRSLNKNYFNEKVFENMINPEREYKKITNIDIVEEKKTLWFLRNYENAGMFMVNIFDMEKELYSMIEDSRCRHFLQKIINLVHGGKPPFDIIKYYNMKKIDNYDDINYMKEYLDVFMHIHNNLSSSTKYLIIQRLCKSLFEDFNKMIFSAII